ncbi:MAG: trypsin-like serine protease [Planctomycetota bacterium]
MYQKQRHPTAYSPSIRGWLTVAAAGLAIAAPTTGRAVVIAGSGGLGPGDFTTAPGVAVNGINHDGIGELRIRTDQGGFRGSSALLWTGRHLITAAHVVTGNSGAIDLSSTRNSRVTFELSGGSTSYNFRADDVTVHPLWTGSLLGGRDLALIDLGQVIDAEVPRYNLLTGTSFTDDIEDQAFTMFGYGRTGTGLTGDTQDSGTKRWGMNQYELNFTSARIGYDFDNGLADQDYIGEVFGKPDLGLGDFEASSAPGDSGGATFFSDPDAPAGGWIVGITSYGSRDSRTDINNGLNASFGEYSVDTDVSELASWVFSELGSQPIPEPSGRLLFLFCAAAACSRPVVLRTINGPGLSRTDRKTAS